MFIHLYRQGNKNKTNKPNRFADGLPAGRTWLLRLCVTLSGCTEAQVFWELYLTPLARALIEAAAVFSRALSPINGVWPDLKHLGGRSSSAAVTQFLPPSSARTASRGKEPLEVCETPGSARNLSIQLSLSLACVLRSTIKTKETKLPASVL